MPITPSNLKRVHVDRHQQHNGQTQFNANTWFSEKELKETIIERVSPTTGFPVPLTNNTAMNGRIAFFVGEKDSGTGEWIKRPGYIFYNYEDRNETEQDFVIGNVEMYTNSRGWEYIGDESSYVPGAPLRFKSCVVKTQGNIANLASAPSTIDGITLADGDRILVASQTNKAQNGVYVKSGTVWTRATDADEWEEFSNLMVVVQSGTVSGKTVWFCSAGATGTIGTDPIEFFNTNFGITYSAANLNSVPNPSNSYAPYERQDGTVFKFLRLVADNGISLTYRAGGPGTDPYYEISFNQTTADVMEIREYTFPNAAVSANGYQDIEHGFDIQASIPTVQAYMSDSANGGFTIVDLDIVVRAETLRIWTPTALTTGDIGKYKIVMTGKLRGE